MVITGGPCSGKTRLIECLSKLGFCTVPEAAIQIIQELIERVGFDDQIRWREAHSTRFQKLVMDRQRLLESKIPTHHELVFLDRGLHDGLAYLSHHDSLPNSELRLEYGPYSYEGVFILDTLNAFDQRLETGRTEDIVSSWSLRDQLHHIYSELGARMLRVPESPIEARARLVLETCDVWSQASRASGESGL